MNMQLRNPKIPFAKPDLTEQEFRAVQTVMMSGNLTSGNQVRIFEEKFAEFVGAKHAVAVASCTQGFLVTFSALSIAKAKAVGPVYTFTGPSTMVIMEGADMQFIDNEKDQFTPSVVAMAEAANKHNAFAMPVHFAGAPFDIEGLRKLMRPNLPIIDDAAHALLSGSRGKYVGANGATATVFSFYTTKTLCTGHGGMITTDNADLAKDMRAIRLHGIGRDLAAREQGRRPSYRYSVDYFGWKANMTDMAAAMGIIQLERLLEMQAARNDIAHEYTERLSGIKDLKVAYPPEKNPGHCYHLFPILVPTKRRDKIVQLLEQDGIGTSVHFIPLHQHPAWAQDDKDFVFPNADEMFASEISLPIYSTMDDREIDRVCKAVENALWIK
jgi:dTDP-4-amino-4,6-dideoxygalactose transaminase